MSIKTKRKLVLQKESLRRLNPADLSKVHGGLKPLPTGPFTNDNCPTDGTSQIAMACGNSKKPCDQSGKPECDWASGFPGCN